MADMLTIGTQAVNTFKRALDVTSHNVANVSTEGYSRQRAEIVSNTPNLVGSTFLGGGSAVSTIERINAEYIQRQLYTSSALVERFDTSNALARQVEGVVAGNDEGVKEFMQRFFDSLQTVASNPTSAESRQLVVDEAGNLESHISNLTSVLNDIESQTNDQIKGLTNEINDRLSTIQDINAQVERALAVGSQPPNDLLDQRDQAILELSQYIDIETYPQEDGSIDIHTSGGKVPLIDDNTVTRLEAANGPYTDEGRTEIYAYFGGDRRVISDKITGGQLGGVLDFRTEMLDQAQNDLGLTLNGMVASMNWQNYQGYDLNGEVGGNIYEPLNAKVLNSRTNADGSSDGSNISVVFNPPKPVATTPEPPYAAGEPDSYGEKNAYFENAISTIGEFQSREYELRYDESIDGGNGGFYVFDRKTSERLGEFANDSTQPVIIDGLEFTGDDGTYSQGDSFLVQPHQDILDNFKTEINDPDKLATRGQSPIVEHYDAAWDDDSDGEISFDEFIANSGVASDSAADFDTFFAGATPAVNNIGTVMDANGDGFITKDEFSLQLASIPAAAAYGDNTNVANMASLQSKEILLSDDNGNASATVLGGYSIMSSNVGLYVRSTDIQLTAQENVHQQIIDRRDSISGVSLDEEAANLLRFQQAYEASAQIISASQSLFQTLIGVVRG